MSTPLVAPAKPKNARSKRAQQQRAAVLVEKVAKTAVFVRTAGISDKVKTALSELVRSLHFDQPPGRR
jgi:ribosome production factor 2